MERQRNTYKVLSKQKVREDTMRVYWGIDPSLFEKKEEVSSYTVHTLSPDYEIGDKKQVIFKTLCGNCFYVPFSKKDTLFELKLKIWDIYKFDCEHYRIIFQGKQWADNKTMDEVKAQDLSTFYIVAPMRGC